MSKILGVGIVGCGNISEAYMSLSSMFKGIEVRACSDKNMKFAKVRAEQFGLRAERMEKILSANDIDIIVNLTIPDAHYAVSRKILESGKHVYSEKPFVLSLKEGKDLARIAKRKNLRVGSAPDTFLGGAHQHARHLIDSGVIGKITGGTAHVMSHGMEHWHPNPDFFFKPGAGPVLDVGPYYVTNLIQLIGPVKRVAAISSTPSKTRTITSKPRAGQKLKVTTPTTINAILEFENGANVSMGASWDVWSHEHNNMELYGETGTLYVPDPNFFGGTVRQTQGDKKLKKLKKFNHPFSVPNQKHAQGPMANYRVSGLADMALAIMAGRPHRCSLEISLHAVDVMTSILKSGETGRFVKMTTTCERPEPLGIREAKALMAPTKNKEKKTKK